MAEMPVSYLAFQGNVNARLYIFMDLEVEIVTDAELGAQVRVKGSAMKVAQAFNKWLNGEMGAAKVGDMIEFENPHCDGKCGVKWCAGNEAVMENGSRSALVSY